MALGSTRAISGACADRCRAASFCASSTVRAFDQGALGIEQARRVAQKNQLVRLDRDGNGFGNFFPGQIEYLAGRRGADRRDQDQVFLGKVGVNFLGDHFAHGAGVLEVDAIDHADRARGNEIAAGDAQEGAGHRRVGQALRQQRLDLDAAHAHGPFDAFQSRGIGDAQALVELRREAACVHLGVDLRPRAMHQHQAYAHAVEQRDVVDQRLRGARFEHFATEGDDEGAAAKGVDVGRRLAHPGHQAGVGVVLAAAGLGRHAARLPFVGLAALAADDLDRAEASGRGGPAAGFAGLAGAAARAGAACFAAFPSSFLLSSLAVFSFLLDLGGFSGLACGIGLPSSSASRRSQIVRRILTRA